jgi:hypothetical protein
MRLEFALEQLKDLGGKNEKLENQIIDLKAQILSRDNIIDDLNKKIFELVAINLLNQ